MSWSGKMTCKVVNQTDGPIAVVAQHVLGEPYVNRLPLTKLEKDGRAEFEINVGSGANDLWSVWFIDATGTFWYRDSKRCNVEEEDYKSNSPVTLNLGTGSQGFSVVTPVSSPCNNNSYKECP